MRFINWLISLFKKKDAVKPPVPTNTSSVKKIALIIGHGNGDSGAMCWNGMEEYDYNSGVAELVASTITEKEVKIFRRTSSGIIGVAALAVAWKPDITIELHLNAYNGKAKGCEVLVLDGDKESSVLGLSFALSFCNKFGRILRRDRGINWITSSDRGYISLNALSSVKASILVEPFFCDNRDEWIPQEVYAMFLIDWLKGL